MSGFIPVSLFGLEVPAGEVLIPAARDFPCNIRITMAAIDPTESVDEVKGKPQRSTLRLIKTRIDSEDDDEDSDEDDEDDETLNALLAASSDDEDEDDEDKKSKTEALKKLIAAAKAEQEEDDDDSDEDMEDAKPSKKSKKATKADEESDSEDEDDDEDLPSDLEEYVVCTLDVNQHYQQPLDIHVSEGEQAFFVVSGTHTVYLTGNYVIDPEEDPDQDSEDDEDYDSEDDEDYDDAEDDSEEDELDDLENPRITEIDSDEEDEEEAPKLVETKTKPAKGKKRAAEAEDEEDLDALIAKAATDKKQKKQKLDAKAEDKKKVQFAKQLEQGPTNSKAAEKPAAAAAAATPSVKVVQGVKIDDRKVGTGRTAKSGDTVGMRYIGKLENGKVFDSNKKGRPFSFKLGKGEVIKGWDVGVAGMAIGGERRLIVPAKQAYGNKALPGIPANSTLIFDVKLLEIK